jgi:hypothetical protein
MASTPPADHSKPLQSPRSGLRPPPEVTPPVWPSMPVPPSTPAAVPALHR